jgi:hypothetical protein
MEHAMNPFRSRSSQARNPFRAQVTRMLARMGTAPTWFRASNPVRTNPWQPSDYTNLLSQAAVLIPQIQKIRDATTQQSASAPFRCWGPEWDRSCKVCVPLPTGGESCTSFKVNDALDVPPETPTYTGQIPTKPQGSV